MIWMARDPSLASLGWDLDNSTTYISISTYAMTVGTWGLLRASLPEEAPTEKRLLRSCSVNAGKKGMEEEEGEGEGGQHWQR